MLPRTDAAAGELSRICSPQGSVLDAQDTAPLKWPHALARRGARLLDAQCWAWGQDIRREEGNLLLEYGFTRLRAPEGSGGCSQYTLALDEESIIRIWGFGVFAGTREGVYLNRFAFVPRTAPRCDAWDASLLDSQPRALSLEHVGAFLDWAVRYESWIQERLGERYRPMTLNRRSSAVQPDLIAGWRRFGEELVSRMDAAPVEA
ncbi:hypothetical protein [Silvibacterium sp.]|uniref:hypothetical protein n=1 Tax=Silvibacterium sp. TaxID=1964179 RepID=UPI0039E2E382